MLFFVKQKTAYEMRISDWSSDVCSSDLLLKLMDLDAIELDENNDLEGVEEEVMRLQEEYPELFNDGSESVEKDDKESTDEDEDKPARRRPVRRTTSRSQDGAGKKPAPKKLRSEEHTSELQSLMRNSYA